MMKLEEEKLYRPYIKGVYQVAPLLRPLPGAMDGSIDMDQRVFQICANFDRYRQSKIRSLEDNPKKYSGSQNFSSSKQAWVLNFMTQRLVMEYPHIFKKSGNIGEEFKFECLHTGDTLMITPDLKLKEGPSQAGEDPFTALALQIQEDYAVLCLNEETGKDWLAYGSIHSPNHWDPAEKVGQNFFSIHEPIAESGPMIKNSAQIVKMMIHKGPFVRFAWGISTDTYLNHHPTPPDGHDKSEWWGRAFDPEDPQLWVRYERQTIHGHPDENLSFFTIRTFFEDIHQVKKDPEAKEALKNALRSMTKRSLEYKGLSKSLDSILEWIDA